MTTPQKQRTDVRGIKNVDVCREISILFEKTFGKTIFKTLSLNFMWVEFLFVPEDYPSNQQYIKHFAEFLRYGYKPQLGAIEVKFPWRDRESRAIGDHLVGIVDGQTKIIIMLSILSFCKELELNDRDLEHPTLSKTLKSFASISCSYSHFNHPGHHFLYSLRHLELFEVSEQFSVWFSVVFSWVTHAK